MFRVFAQIRQDIGSADLNPSSKRSMLAVFDKAVERGQPQLAEIWLLDEQILSQIEGAIKLLGANHHAWQVDSGQLVFRRQADLDLFNSYMSQVQAIETKQEQMQNASLRKAQESLSKLGQ